MPRAKSPRRPPSVNHPPFDEVADISKHVIVKDEFLGDVTGDLGGWVLANVAGTGSVAIQAATAGQVGVVRLSSGSTSSNESSLILSNADTLVLPAGDNDPVYVAFALSLPLITSVEVTVGLFDSGTAAGRGTNSVCLEFDASVNAFWQPVVVDGSSATAPTVDADEQVLATAGLVLVEISAHADACEFWVNRQFVATVTGADIPDAEGLQPAVKVATETGSARSVDVDAFILRQSVTRVG